MSIKINNYLYLFKYIRRKLLKDVIYVTGHKNPDSDSICAAIRIC